jgi:ribulose-phosphate 3-epimerase
MDGRFVPNITFGQHVIRQLRPVSSLLFDVHLMIEEPERYLEDFRDAGADVLTIHAESTRHAQRALAEIRRLGMKAGLALNPATSLACLDHLLDDLDMVLIMSVNPGFGGQAFLPSAYAKVEALKRRVGGRPCLIQVDGGVDLDNARRLTGAGADVLVAGSAFFRHPPYASRLAAFRASVEHDA